MLQQAPLYAYLPARDGHHVFEDGGTKAAWFKDSEGNILALIQMA